MQHKPAVVSNKQICGADAGSEARADLQSRELARMLLEQVQGSGEGPGGLLYIAHLQHHVCHSCQGGGSLCSIAG